MLIRRVSVNETEVQAACMLFCFSPTRRNAYFMGSLSSCFMAASRMRVITVMHNAMLRQSRDCICFYVGRELYTANKPISTSGAKEKINSTEQL